MEIVIARYNEPVEWTRKFSVTIYNKGPPTPYETIPLPNVGREGHTYYTHIYNNYYTLADTTVFLQGNPFDHSPNILEKLRELSKRKCVGFEYLSEKVYQSNTWECPYHAGLPLSRVYEELFGLSQVGGMCKWLTGRFYMPFEFGAGAQFAVTRERIHRRPREFYLKIIKMLEGSVNPVEGFVIERFHGMVFA
uniref:Uncharacterized protein n=1 Tax=viral metagenome TaxID=1070528 RepID=A0A6C0L5X8_9ZZZZ